LSLSPIKGEERDQLIAQWEPERTKEAKQREDKALDGKSPMQPTSNAGGASSVRVSSGPPEESNSADHITWNYISTDNPADMDKEQETLETRLEGNSQDISVSVLAQVIMTSKNDKAKIFKVEILSQLPNCNITSSVLQYLLDWVRGELDKDGGVSLMGEFIIDTPKFVGLSAKVCRTQFDNVVRISPPSITTDKVRDTLQFEWDKLTQAEEKKRQATQAMEELLAEEFVAGQHDKKDKKKGKKKGKKKNRKGIIRRAYLRIAFTHWKKWNNFNKSVSFLKCADTIILRKAFTHWNNLKKPQKRCS
jgi:hypothetical protein